MKKFFIGIIFSILFCQFICASIYLDTDVSYNKNKFHSTDYYYLGAASINEGVDALVRAYVYTDTGVDPNVNKVGIKKLAPQKSYVNREDLPGTKQSNPIYNADIKYLSLMSRYPVVVLGTGGLLGADQTVCLVRDSEEGSIVSTNKSILKAANNADCGGIAGIESSNSNIFAAVKPNGSAVFGGANSGICVLSSPTESEITSVKAVVLTSALGTLADFVTMYWDSTINRLFVGLQVSTYNPSYSLLVGYIDGSGTLVLRPVLPVAPTNDNYIIGAGSTNAARIHRVKTMHTSTGKSYVIVVGNVNSANYTKEVFALPIVHQQYANGTFANSYPDQIGKLAKKTSTSQEEIVDDVSQLFVKTNAEAIVGKGAFPEGINDMFVVGDDVFVCCIGATGDKRGIFKSTALFDDTGLTASWTPWQRVMGSTDNVIGGSLDDNNGNYWYLTKNTGETKDSVIKVTQWGTGDTNLLGTLRTNLASNFTQENAGVHQIFDFDEKTVGFFTDQFSMLVATGYQKIALIKSGKQSGGVFVPTAAGDFSSAANFSVRTDSALSQIGPICCAEVSRSGIADKGWIFVGGYEGVAVLRNGTTGRGWDGNEGLSNVDSALSGFTFKKIGNFRYVHKLFCDGTCLYVMTPQTLYRITMAANKFDDAETAALGSVIIAEAGTSPFGSNDHFLDFIVSSKVGLLATTSGLFRTSDGNSVKTTGLKTDWTEVKTVVGSTEYSMGPVVHLHMVSYLKGSFLNGGNLYVLAGDISHDLASVFRFRVRDTSSVAIDINTVKPITEYKTYSTDSQPAHFYNIGGFRNAFVTDGASGYHMLPKSFGNTEFIRKVKMMSRKDLMKVYDATVSLDVDGDSRYCGVPVMNSASGAWVVPGDWVLRFNE